MGGKLELAHGLERDPRFLYMGTVESLRVYPAKPVSATDLRTAEMLTFAFLANTLRRVADCDVTATGGVFRAKLIGIRADDESGRNWILEFIGGGSVKGIEVLVRLPG
jgi:hypothetical protein